MSTWVLGDEPVIEDWLAQRRALSQDGRDEVWEGVYVVAPHEHPRNGKVAVRLSVLLDARARRAGFEPGGSFNLGDEGDFRVPDLGFHSGPADEAFVPSAALVIEVLTPRDQTWQKFDFYARHGVAEVWVVDPLDRNARCFRLQDGAYEQAPVSALLDLPMAQLVAELEWPP